MDNIGSAYFQFSFTKHESKSKSIRANDHEMQDTIVCINIHLVEFYAYFFLHNALSYKIDLSNHNHLYQTN